MGGYRSGTHLTTAALSKRLLHMTFSGTAKGASSNFLKIFDRGSQLSVKSVCLSAQFCLFGRSLQSCNLSKSCCTSNNISFITRMTKRFPFFINSSFNTISTNNDRDNKITETVNRILALWSKTSFMPKSMAIQVQGNFWLVHQVFNTNSTKIRTHAKGWIHSLQ